MIKRFNLIRFGIDAREVAAFPKIAIGAGQGEIVQFIASRVLTRDDVLDLQRNQRRINLAPLTVFAALPSPLADGGSCSRVHCNQLSRGAKRNLASACKTASRLFASI